MKYTTTYSAAFSGTFSEATNSFEGTISVGGTATGQQITFFTHPACAGFNGQPIPGKSWSGSGTVRGAISRLAVSINTNWTAGSAVAGGATGLDP